MNFRKISIGSISNNGELLKKIKMLKLGKKQIRK